MIIYVMKFDNLPVTTTTKKRSSFKVIIINQTIFKSFLSISGLVLKERKSIMGLN